MATFNYDAFFDRQIDNLKMSGQYRTFVKIQRRAGAFPRATHNDGYARKEIIVWCSNDHLGMGQFPSILGAMHDSIRSAGAAAGGSRNISGTNPVHVALEREVADLHQKDMGLTFITGYAVNDAVLGVLGEYLPKPIFFSDQKNHASIIRGIRATRAEKLVFRHNDVSHLHELLEAADPERPKIVVFESIYSMDGDVAPMVELCEIAKAHGALVYVDEAHSVGMYGPQGAGMGAHLGCMQEIDLLMGTFAKGYGTAGGYLVGSTPIVDAIRSLAPAFIFTLAMPPALAAGALTSVRYLRTSDRERISLRERSTLLQSLLTNLAIPMASTDSHIVPVIVGDPFKCQALANALLHDCHQYLQPINYPSVERGGERLRINPSPVHSTEQIQSLVTNLDGLWTDLALPRASSLLGNTQVIGKRLSAY